MEDMEEKNTEEGKTADVWETLRRLTDVGYSRLQGYTRKSVDFGKGLSRTERLAILFAIGIIAGYGVKLAARDAITIGYDDYTLKGSERAYDLLEMERRQKEAAVSDMEASGDDTSVIDTGATCQ